MATRRCSCKKSECLKLYCDCLAAGVACGDSCQCVACKNKGDLESAASSPATGFQRAKAPVARVDATPPPPPKIGGLPTSYTARGLGSAVELSTMRSATGGDNGAIPVIRLQMPSILAPRLAPHLPCDCISGFCHEACPCARLESCLPECACGGSCRSTRGRLIAPRDKASLIPREKPKGCSCKKSHCLKLYCECLAANRMCGEHCNCHNCKNFPGCEEDRDRAIENILERNPMAFQPKVASGTSQHLRGCNCRKSGCLKNYCECFQAGVACTSRCACLQCGNKSASSLPGDVAMDPEVRLRRQRQQQRRLMIEQRSKSGVKSVRKASSNPASPVQQTTTIAPSLAASSGSRPLSALEMLSQTVPNSAGTTKAGAVKSTLTSKRTHASSGSPTLTSQPFQAHSKRNLGSKSSAQRFATTGVSLSTPTNGASPATTNASPTRLMALPDVNRVLGAAYYRKESRRVGSATSKEAAPGSSVVSMLCQSLLAAAVRLDGEGAASSGEHSNSSARYASGSPNSSSPMLVDERRDEDGDEDMEDNEVSGMRSREGSLSPGATGLLCDEDMERDDDDDNEHQNRQGREKRARLAVAQERAVLQEFSVWLRNMTAASDEVV